MTEKKSKIDLNQTLLAVDKKDRGYYSRLSDEEQKALRGFYYMLQRYVSSSQNATEHHIYFTNLFCNKNFISDTGITRHPELQWLSFCAVGTGRKQHHAYIKPPGARKKRGKLFDALREISPLIKDDDIELMMAINTDQQLREWFQGHGYDDRQIQEIFKKR